MRMIMRRSTCFRFIHCIRRARCFKHTHWHIRNSSFSTYLTECTHSISALNKTCYLIHFDDTHSDIAELGNILSWIRNRSDNTKSVVWRLISYRHGPMSHEHNALANEQNWFLVKKYLSTRAYVNALTYARTHLTRAYSSYDHDTKDYYNIIIPSKQ